MNLANISEICHNIQVCIAEINQLKYEIHNHELTIDYWRRSLDLYGNQQYNQLSIARKSKQILHQQKQIENLIKQL